MSAAWTQEEIEATVAAYFEMLHLELACSQRELDRYQLCRLFDFGPSPGLYVLPGALGRSCSLQPTQFRATVASVE